MAVLLLNGSPRKQNTYNILNQINKKISDNKISTTLENINDYHIEPCIGCYQCFSLGVKSCPLEDDIPLLWNKIFDSEAVIIGSPVFALGVTGILKNFMDRIAYNSHRPLFYNKPMITISTTAGMGIKKVLEQMKWFETLGFTIVGTAGFLTYPIGIDKDKKKDKDDRTMDQLIKNLLTALKRDKQKKSTFIRHLQFQALKLNSEFAKEYYKKDYEFYVNKEFFVETKINIFRKTVLQLFYNTGLRTLKKNIEK